MLKSEGVDVIYCNDIRSRGEIYEIYDSVDDVKELETKREIENISTQKNLQTGRDARWRKCYRLAAVGLGLLCGVLLIAIILLWIQFNHLTAYRDKLKTSNTNLTTERDLLKTSNTNLTTERDLLKTSNTNLTAERDQLKTSNTNLTAERDQLQTNYTNLTAERDHLQTSYTNLTAERDQLQTSYTNLTAERDQLQTSNTNLTTERDKLQTSYTKLTAEIDQLQTSYTNLTAERDHLQKERDKILRGIGLWGGYFNSSLYYLTMNKKSWSDSRNECQQNGADLVIINSREEQEFINKTFLSTEAWLGLTDIAKEGDFRWVDGSSPIIQFWWTGEPNDYGGNEDCAITGFRKAQSDIFTWADFPCAFGVLGLCEKLLS